MGIPGGLEQYLAGGVNDRAVTGTVINVVSAHGADPTGVTNCYTAVAAAVAAASGPTVIYFPTGSIATGYKDDITIRGAGTASTNFVCSVATPIFICNSPGAYDAAPQTITGTKTKGTATLAIADTTGYTMGRHVVISYENETDNARIQAGAAPVWSSAGFPFARAYTHKITAVVANTSITIDPPLPTDATSLVTKTALYAADNKTSGWGFEDFTMTMDAAEHPTQPIKLDSSEYCWVHNVKFMDWAKATDNGSFIANFNSYRNEISRCYFDIETGASSDGAIGTNISSSCLIVDNIFNGPWDITVYDNGNACNSVIAYNYATGPERGSYFHNAHPSLNLLEGNVVAGHQSDGYHGSSSHNTIYRNAMFGPYSTTLNRFKRNYIVAGNVMGTSGSVTGGISFGNPNISTGVAYGFAGPTGLSNQVGQTDYKQQGVPGFNTYTIVSGDVFAGDFPQDWKSTATLTTRTSATSGTFTVSGGHYYVGDAGNEFGGTLLIQLWWDSRTQSMFNGTVTSVAGSTVTVTWGGGSLPPVSTVCEVFFGPTGFQERDLDVQASSTMAENYIALAAGGGSIVNGTADTLPDSLAWTSKPAFFGSLAWPPVDPNSPNYSVEIIPAGYRYVNEADPPSGGTITTGALNVGTLNVGG